MIKSQHVSQDDLMELLNGDGDSPKTHSIGEHLHACEDCRQALDDLTAQSAMWEKAPLLLKDSAASSVGGTSGSFAPLTVDFPAADDEVLTDEDESQWQYPIAELLEPPKHPEMLGRIGKYDIEREIGRGGMGVVLKAHDAELNRPLAIKVLAPHLASHGTARKRFAQEAIAAAGVLHPNVIAVHGVNNNGRTPYIVMPFVSGPSLQTLVDQQGPLTEIEIVRIALQIASGLAAAHSQGLVHRDIKPANILVEADVNRVLITDFGLARAEDDASLTRTGWLAGTPNYMSPEQTRGERPDQRSDLFSLGSLIYFISTGRLPFRAESPLGVLNRIQNEEPTPVRQVNPQVSKTLSDVINKLLQKSPEQRFQSAADLHQLLEQHLAYLHQPDISKPPRVEFVQGNHTGRRTKLLMGGAALTCLALVLGLSASGFLSFPSPQSDSDDQSSPSSSSATSVAIGSIYDGRSKEERLFEAGNELASLGKIDEALEAFRQVTASTRYAAKAHYNIGCLMALRDQPDEAFAALDKAVDQGFVSVSHFRSDQDLQSLRKDARFAQLVARLKTKQRAEELLCEAIEHAEQQRFADAEALHREALELDPNNERAIANLAFAIHMQGRMDEAIGWHQRTAQTQDYAAVGHYNLCCESALREDTDEALEFLDKAIQLGLAQHLDEEFLDRDADLDNLRGEERFAEALANFRESHRQHDRHAMRVSRGHGAMLFSSSGAGQTSLEHLHAEGPVQGTWEAKLDASQLQLTVVRGAEDADWRWGYSAPVKLQEFDEHVTSQTTDFKWTRGPGTLSFHGQFVSVIGEGTFRFVGSKQYQSQLKRQGIEDAPEALLFRLFFVGDNEAREVKNLQQLQELVQDEDARRILMIDGVPADLVRRYQESNLSISDNLHFLVWRVPAALITSYQDAGLDPREHQSFINERVPAALLKSYREAGFQLQPVRQFITWRVPPQLLVEYRSAGLDPDEYAEFINHRVSASLLEGYQQAGFDPLHHRKFINWRVDPELLAAYRAAELPLDEYGDFINMRVSPGRLRAYEDAGLDVEHYREFVQSSVDPKLLSGYVKAALPLASYREFILSGVSAEFVQRYRRLSLDPQHFKEFIISRIDPELIDRYKAAGLDPWKHRTDIHRRRSPQKVKQELQQGIWQ